MSPKMLVVSRAATDSSSRDVRLSSFTPKGSHVRLRHPTDTQRQAVTVPFHKEIAFGTLRRILRDARISVDELASVL